MFVGQKFAFWPKKHIFMGTNIRGIKIRNTVIILRHLFSRGKKFVLTLPLSRISQSFYPAKIFPYTVIKGWRSWTPRTYFWVWVLCNLKIIPMPYSMWWNILYYVLGQMWVLTKCGRRVSNTICMAILRFPGILPAGVSCDWCFCSASLLCVSSCLHVDSGACDALSAAAANEDTPTSASSPLCSISNIASRRL